MIRQHVRGFISLINSASGKESQPAAERRQSLAQGVAIPMNRDERNPGIMFQKNYEPTLVGDRGLQRLSPALRAHGL